MKSADIREKFLSFFEAKGHRRVPSSPLVPANDPTLLFTNSGMVQFKDVFLGFDKRPYQTATTAQRCLRAGGKHNDLQNVGYTARHHTFFEMLGNFSFGDYFKELAIPMAWEFLTSPEYLNIDKEHLWVTVFGGGNIFGDNSPAVPSDNDSYELWKKTLMNAGFSEKEAERRITNIPTTDNFWMMGDVGPCGPCSEIFYDRDKAAKTFRGEDEAHADECVEVWNLVFMEFNRDDEGVLHKLPAPCVDTGMGLERIAAVMQGKNSNYETDMFCELLAEVQKVVKSNGDFTPSHRVVADHIRAAAYLIADGVLPDNEGRGYVLRKIIRRALIHGAKAANQQNLGASDPWFDGLVKPLSKIMGSEGGILRDKHDEIANVLAQEERGFQKNYLQGRAHLTEKIAKIKPAKQKAKTEFPGEAAFELYDTFGFPVEATLDEVLAANFSGIDMDAYDKCMSEQRARSRAATKFNAGQTAVNYDGEATNFVGYDSLTCEAKVCAIYADGKSIKTAKTGDEVLLVMDNTPFYAESGGQIGDAGVIRGDNGEAAVIDAQKIRADVWGHVVNVKNGALSVGDNVVCETDSARRGAIACHHSATHLMHSALRQVLGSHVRQKGSLVAPEYLRFDFSHNSAPDESQLREVENIVNSQIRANAETKVESLSYDDALARGAMALFGEKYGDVVRMVEIDPDFSIELCGGTHVARAGDIGFFQVRSEGAVASGVRRIEAVCGHAAVLAAQESISQLRQIAGMMKSPLQQAVEQVSQLRESFKGAQKQITAMQQAQTASQMNELTAGATKINGINVLSAKVTAADMKMLRECAATMRGQLSPCAVFLAGDGGGVASFVAACDGADIDARKLIEAATNIAGGKGGGKENYAQAGGGDAGKIDAALAAARAVVEA